MNDLKRKRPLKLTNDGFKDGAEKSQLQDARIPNSTDIIRFAKAEIWRVTAVIREWISNRY